MKKNYGEKLAFFFFHFSESHAFAYYASVAFGGFIYLEMTKIVTTENIEHLFERILKTFRINEKMWEQKQD